MNFATLQFMLVYIACHVRWPSEALPLSKFYPFGQSNGDQLVVPNDDGSSGNVPISISFPFFDHYHDSLFVNTNGVISFLVQVSQYTPDAFPLGDDRRLVAPYWADADTRKGGNVWYRETTDPSLLQTATDDVLNAFVNHRKFQAAWLNIVTWHNVTFFGATGNYTSKRNTFQAVLITNGRHSFVIYNYNKLTWTTGTSSGGNKTGLGGTPAQAGFNAGDGTRYFSIPGSRTGQVLDLPTKSNIGKPGQWMFRIDNAKIEAGGCNTKGSLIISPRSGNMLGGENIFIAGPCFTAADNIVCEFAGGKASKGSYISDIRASCTVPMLNVTGRLPLRMSVNGGKSFDFQGIFSIVNINRERPRVTRKMPQMWVEQRPVNIEWDPQALGGENQTVSVRLVRFAMQDDHVSFHSMLTLVSEQMNTGHSQFSVPNRQGDGTPSRRFVTLVSVKRTGAKRNQSPAEWIWSDVFSWISYTWGHDRCISWHRKQPNPKIFTDDDSLLHCPQTFVQAMADRGRFMFDEYCNPGAEEHCIMYHAGATHCFRSNTPSNQGAGQQCCYNTQGNLMSGPERGSLDRFHIDAGIPALSHFFHDLVPYLDCCLFSDNCAKYFEKRPSDDGSKYVPPRPATGFGDPHMITLDEVEYTFNGYGEYRILEVAVTNFTLQGRMLPLTSDSGAQSKATVFKAFAMKERGSDVVQIHINGRDDIEVLVNGDVVEFDEQVQLMVEFNGVVVVNYVNTSKYSAVFNSGISVTVEKAEDVLQMILLVPAIFKGNTSGLLGFWDGDQEKEFLLPNGAFLDTNSSQSTIHHEFGQLWVTTANESVFTYEEGRSHSSYFDTGYVPIFLDQDNLVFQNATLGQQARDTCGSNKQCLFDIHATGKVSIGKASMRTMELFTAVVSETQTPGCIAIESALQNGSTQRNDTNEGRVTYAFECHPGFLLKGSAVISCLRGKWNGSTPSCVSQDPARIQKSSGNQTVNESFASELLCIASGNPSPKITWSLPNGSRIFLQGNGSLVITNTTRKAHGRYMCTASNGIGDTSSDVMYLNVQYKPAINTSGHVNKIKSWLGRNSTLDCWADGNPSPKIVWSRNDGGPLHSTTSGSISIIPKEVKDFGKYSCTAENLLGKHRLVVELVRTAFPPSSPKILNTETELRNRSLILRWTSSSDNGRPILRYTVWHRVVFFDNATKRNWIRTDAGKYLYYNLSLDWAMSYHVAVTAVNDQGASNKSDIKSFTVFPEPTPKASYPPTTSDLVCTSSNNDIQVNGSNPSSISSPNYPAEYPDNLQCTWRITTAVQSRIKVTIKGVDFGNNDFIVFRDGNMEDSPEIAKYAKCAGGELQLYSTGRHMLVNFVSDAGSPGKGFQLDYQAVPSDKVICQPKSAEPCIYRDADGKSGVIRNPASPQGLGADVYCSVTLQVPAGNRMLLTYYWFGLAGKTGRSCRDDEVQVRAAVGGSTSDKYCGCDLPPKKIYDSEKVYLQLLTWRAANRPGLMASYRALGPHECIDGAATCAPRARPIGSNKDGDYCYDTMLEEEGGEVVLNNTSKLQIECDKYITVTVKRSDYPGFAPYTATLDDPDCKATFVNETVVTFKFGPEYCKTIAEDDGEKIHYKNAIHAKVEMHSDDSAITRKHMTVLPFQCSYEKKATISKVSYSPRVSKVITSAADFGNFTYFMDMYTTEDYDDKVDEYPVEVGLGQRMFLEIRVESGDKDLLLFPEMCKATLSSKYSDKPDHEFIKDTCSRDNTLEYDYSMSAVQRFSLVAFRFKDGYDDVFLHCKMTVCRKQDSESRCVKGCEASGDGSGDGGRKRRSVPEDYSVNLYVGPVGIQETQEADPGSAQTEQTVEGSSSTMVVIVAVVGILAVVAVGLIVAMVIIFKRRRPFSHTSILVVPEDEDH